MILLHSLDRVERGSRIADDPGQVDDRIRFAYGFDDGADIGNVVYDEPEVLVLPHTVKPFVSEHELVKNGYLIAAFKQLAHHMRADITGSPGNEHAMPFVRHSARQYIEAAEPSPAIDKRDLAQG